MNRKPIRRRPTRRTGRLQLESLETRALLSATLVDGVLTVDGTDAADEVRIGERGSSVMVSVNGERQTFAAEDVQQIVVNALAGDDRVMIQPRTSIATTIDGGDGADLISSGGGDDQIAGGSGADQIRGGAGADTIDGGDDNDKLAGDAGTDTVSGGAGDDTLADSTGEDSLDGGDGENTIVTDVPTRPGRPGRGPGGRGPGGRGGGGFNSGRPDFRIPRTPGVLDGWDGAGQGSAQLTYYFGDLTSDLPDDTTKAVLQAALAEWAAVVDVVFTETDTAGLANSIDFQFATGNHGDGSSFDGTGGELAHTFLPVNTFNPIAGDVHFDGAETWEVGDSGAANAYDLMYVAVHEIGHALGLLHSSDPASVMFDTVTASTVYAALAAADMSAILSLYAPAVVTATVPNSAASVSASSSAVTTSDAGTSADAGETTTTETGSSETGTTETDTTDTTGSETTETGTTETDTTDSDTTETDTTDTDTTDTTDTDTTDTDTTDTDTTTECDPTSGDSELSSGTHHGHDPIADFDANGDGVLTVDEVPETLWEHLVRADADGDGSITADELAAFRPVRHDPFAEFDTNDDGVLTVDEVPETLWEHLVRADADGDGSVTADELAAFRPVRHGHDPIADFDSNGDGALTVDEVPESIWDHLVRADADGDGSITADELAAVVPARPAGPPHGPRPFGRR